MEATAALADRVRFGPGRHSTEHDTTANTRTHAGWLDQVVVAMMRYIGPLGALFGSVRDREALEE